MLVSRLSSVLCSIKPLIFTAWQQTSSVCLVSSAAMLCPIYLFILFFSERTRWTSGGSCEPWLTSGQSRTTRRTRTPQPASLSTAGRTSCSVSSALCATYLPFSRFAGFQQVNMTCLFFFLILVAFRLYDLDRDDKISRDELLQVRNKLEKLKSPDGKNENDRILASS